MILPGKISIRQLITYGLFVLCVFATWARGGTYPPYQWPLILLTLFICLSPLLFEKDRWRSVYNAIMRDPIFGLGLALLLIIFYQWVNSNFSVILNLSGGAQLVEEPPIWIPWSVTREEAGEMFVWFFPVWVGALFIRNVLRRRHVRRLLYLLAINSAVLACAGLMIAAAGSDKVLGMWVQRGEPFFASFSYTNHAAAWFYLNAFLAAGLAHDGFSKGRPMVQVGVWAATFFLCTLCVFMTLSRFGALISVALLSFFSFIFFRNALPFFRGNKAANVYILALIILLAGLACFYSVGEGALAREIKFKGIVGEKSLAGDLNKRAAQMPLAGEIIKDYPLFGAGGWSYRWLGMTYYPSSEWDMLRGVGLANVHCDPVQYITEFGIIGFLLISAVFWLLVIDALKGNPQKKGLWILAGIGIVLLHSLIDLPFRCPAILYQSIFMLAIVPKISEKEGS